MMALGAVEVVDEAFEPSPDKGLVWEPESREGSSEVACEVVLKTV